MNLRLLGCATWGIPLGVAWLGYAWLAQSTTVLASALYTFILPLLLFWILLASIFLAKRWECSGWRTRGFQWITLVLMTLIIADGALSLINRFRMQWFMQSDPRYDLVINDWINLRRFDLPPASGFTVPGPFLPNTTGVSADASITIDRFGFRREFTGQWSDLPLNETRNILCLGGSVVFGMTTQPGDLTIPDFLQQKMDERVPQDKLRVLNAAFPGESLPTTYRNLRDVLIHLPLDVVFFCEGINLLAPGQRGVLVERGSAFESWTHNHAVRDSAKKAVDTYDGALYRTALEAMVRLCRENNILLMWSTFALPYQSTDPPYVLRYWNRIQNGQATGYASARLVEIHNDIMREVAATYDVPLIDPARMFSGDASLFLDTCHPTQEGLQHIANDLANLIEAHREAILSLE